LGSQWLTSPAQLERAKTILSNEFETTRLLGILALIFGFVAAGFGLDQLARYLLRGYLGWMKTLDFKTPHGRVKALGARTIFAAILILPLLSAAPACSLPSTGRRC
jgi:hypothetical protein